MRGRVQGVGFRFHVLRQATLLGLVGWVANEPDGSVRCVAEGPAWALRRFADDLREGPPGARVAAVDAAWSTPTGAFSSFGVRSAYHGGD